MPSTNVCIPMNCNHEKEVTLMRNNHIIAETLKITER